MQSGCQVIDVLSPDRVDNAGLAGVPVEHITHLFHQIVARQDSVSEIRPIEIADEQQRLLQRELFCDVAPHLLRRRCGVRMNRRLGKDATQIAQLPIFRTEIVSPVADAMRLVDRERLRAGALQQLTKARHRQALRRNEQQLQLSIEQRALDIPLLARILRTVQLRGRDAAFAQSVDLILHQRNERRHDDRDVVFQQRRHLIAERFAAAGRHDDETVASGKRRVHRFFLKRAECRIAPVAGDDVEERVHRR